MGIINLGGQESVLLELVDTFKAMVCYENIFVVFKLRKLGEVGSNRGEKTGFERAECSACH